MPLKKGVVGSLQMDQTYQIWRWISSLEKKEEIYGFGWRLLGPFTDFFLVVTKKYGNKYAPQFNT